MGEEAKKKKNNIISPIRLVDAVTACDQAGNLRYDVASVEADHLPIAPAPKHRLTRSIAGTKLGLNRGRIRSIHLRLHSIDFLSGENSRELRMAEIASERTVAQLFWLPLSERRRRASCAMCIGNWESLSGFPRRQGYRTPAIATLLGLWLRTSGAMNTLLPER